MAALSIFQTFAALDFLKADIFALQKMCNGGDSLTYTETKMSISDLHSLKTCKTCSEEKGQPIARKDCRHGYSHSKSM